jgi:SSS family solute:Na+ symporter
LLIGYSGVTQFFPGVVLALGARRPPAAAIGAGIVAGILVVATAALLGAPTVYGLNVGVFALLANVASIVATTRVLAISRAPRAEPTPLC